MRQFATQTIAILSTLLLFACGPHTEVVDVEAQYDFVSLTVHAMDDLGRPIQDVEVRILEAWQERDGEYYPATGPNRVRYTGPRGRAVFDSYDLGQSGLGFFTTLEGDAVLYDYLDEDEAIVILEIGSPTLGYIEVDVPLTFLRPFNEVILQY